MASARVPSSNPIKFGNNFELDTQAYELRRAGRPLKLERIPMELLRLLIEQQGQLVTREQITERIWGRAVFVDSDTCINSAIRKIRPVLRDQPENPRFVQTITGRGYRFIAPLAVGMIPHDAVATDEDLSVPVPVAGVVPRFRKPHRYWVAGLWAASALLLLLAVAMARRQFLTKIPSNAIRSIAVLPLENLTGDPGQQYFADGMTDALITSLAEIGSLRVISRTSSMRYRDTAKPLPQIAKELGVDAVVEGSVARSANRVRIDAKLIEAAADRHLWAKSYERDAKDILALQADLAGAITSQVQNQLTPKQQARVATAPHKEGPIDPQVYELYLKGRDVMRRGGLPDVRQAIEYFQSGLMKDPNSALLYTGLADAYIHKMSDVYESPTEAVAEARKAVTRALELNDLSGEAHTSLASIKLFYDWDWKAGEKELRRAMELDPSYPVPYRLFGGYLTMIGLTRSPHLILKRPEDWIRSFKETT